MQFGNQERIVMIQSLQSRCNSKLLPSPSPNMNRRFLHHHGRLAGMKQLQEKDVIVCQFGRLNLLETQFMMKYLEKNCRKGKFCPSKLKGKRVIELGAGCGVAGFACTSP